MGKRAIVFVIVALLLILGVYYFTQSSASQQSYSNQSYSGQTSSGNTIHYYLRYSNGIEWVLVPPGQFANQTIWLEYPYGLDENGYNIVGRWERVSPNLAVFVPQTAPTYSQSDNYNVSAARARTMVEQQWQSIDNAPDYAQPGNIDACSVTDCVDPSSVSGDSPDTSDP